MDSFLQVIDESWGTHESGLFDTFHSLDDFGDEQLRGRFRDKGSSDDHFRLAV